MGKSTFRVGRPHHKHTRRASPNSSCETGGFYQSPTFNDRVNSLEPLEIKWDNTCLDTQLVDIRLNAPKLPHSQLYVWTNVPFATGSITVDLKPRWWNASSSVDLQVAIVPSGKSIYSTNLRMPAPPIFTATYSEPASGAPASADTSIGEPSYMDVQSALATKKGLTPGKTAAAVIIPLLVVIAGVLFFLRWQRKKSAEKSQRFSVAVDKRMSTISTDWKSVTAAGANAAIRNSMAISGNRNSSFSFGGIRPNSTFTTDGGSENQAGVGRPSLGSGVGYGARQMQTGVGVGLRNPASLASNGERVSRVSFATDVRQSRVSFATDSRPSIDSRRTRFQDVYVPPVPALPPTAVTATSSDRSSEDGDATFSPRQAQGALTLTPEDIRARIAAGRARSASNANSNSNNSTSTSNSNTHGNNSSNDDIMAALSMMRTGSGEGQGDEYLFPTPPQPIASPTNQIPPVPTSPPPSTVMSPVMGTIQMPMPDSYMSPDEMLRAYAERKKSGIQQVSGPMVLPMSPPPPSQGRSLFGPTGVVSPNNTGNKNRESGVGNYGGAKYVVGDDDDAYGGMGY